MKNERALFDELIALQEQLVEETRDTDGTNVSKKKEDEGEH